MKKLLFTSYLAVAEIHNACIGMLVFRTFDCRIATVRNISGNICRRPSIVAEIALKWCEMRCSA
jgi:hypothetical protein